MSRVIAITGASGALGQAIQREALKSGLRVAAINRSPSQPSDSPDLAIIGDADVSDANQATQAIAHVVKTFGQLDVLVNVAGTFTMENVRDGSSETWDRMFAANLATALNTSRAAISHLQKSDAGRIINIGAMGALQAGKGMGPYAASKSAVHRLTEALAAELKGTITVNAVLPSTINTAQNRSAMPTANFNEWVQPEEIAQIILFLASTQSSGVTGALIPAPGRV